MLIEHLEAKHEVKVRPAVVLRVLGDMVLLVTGRSRQPLRGEALEIGPRTHLPDRGAGLDNTTFFGSEDVLAVPLERIKRRIGQLSPKRFMALDALTERRRIYLQEMAGVRAEAQRKHLKRHVEEHIQGDKARLDRVADEARMARVRLRQLIYEEDTFWTRNELHALAQVLRKPPGALIGEDEEPPESDVVDP